MSTYPVSNATVLTSRTPQTIVESSYSPMHAAIQSCGICLEDFQNQERLRGHGSHMFHIGCLDQWLEKRRICPICQDSLVEASDARLQRVFFLRMLAWVGWGFVGRGVGSGQTALGNEHGNPNAPRIGFDWEQNPEEVRFDWQSPLGNEHRNPNAPRIGFDWEQNPEEVCFDWQSPLGKGHENPRARETFDWEQPFTSGHTVQAIALRPAARARELSEFQKKEKFAMDPKSDLGPRSPSEIIEDLVSRMRRDLRIELKKV